MIIIEMTNEHISSVLEIERDSFTHPWSESSFLSELNKDSSFLYVALDDKEKEVIGYAVMSTVLDEGSLLDIAVSKEYRKQGVAKALFSKLLEVAYENKLSFITLEVRASNTSAKALYDKLGFECVAVRKNYYSKPIEDAILMTKYL